MAVKDTIAGMAPTADIEVITTKAEDQLTRKDISQKKSDGVSGFCCYIGPTIIGVIQSGTIYPKSKAKVLKDRRLIDTILDSANIWLNGLAGAGYLLGARAEMLESENPETSLMAGIIKIHIYMTPPSPAQEIDFVLEYDAEYVSDALQS